MNGSSVALRRLCSFATLKIRSLALARSARGKSIRGPYGPRYPRPFAVHANRMLRTSVAANGLTPHYAATRRRLALRARFSRRLALRARVCVAEGGNRVLFHY